jgi:hypothetical protein
MRRYSDDDERRIRLSGRVRSWTRAGLLEADQGQRLESDLHVDLRRTGAVLRGSLALFTALVVGATVGLVFVLLDIDNEVGGAVMTALAGGACFKGADILASAYRLYRYGVEESLAAAAVLLAAISAALFVSTVWGGAGDDATLVAALSTGAAGSWAMYRRFGFRYAMLACMVCAALVPFQLGLPKPLERALAAAVFAWSFVAARRVRIRHGDEFPGDDASVFQAAAVAGGYLVANLYLTAGLTESHTPSGMAPWFIWLTWLSIWVVAIAGLRLGIVEKDQPLIDTGLALVLATLVSNKPYFGWARQPWDPMLLGVVLMAVGVIVRRWLVSGPGGERAGFTASRMLDRDAVALRALGTVSVGIHPAEDERYPAPGDESAFGGGRSGGAGAGGTF